ncbi:hypothetical protein [Streptomyces sp. NPDC058735]|uniref:hypothetical protein n=1 Tax=unclassified Streptomyces TaxID=2593676 RepID=UPI0036BA5B3B
MGAAAGPVAAAASWGFRPRLPGLEDGWLVGVFVPRRDGFRTAGGSSYRWWTSKTAKVRNGSSKPW